MPFRTHLLVVANQTVDSPGLMTALRDRARQGAIRVTLLAPVLWSEREEARARLDAACEKLRSEGIEAEGVLGDADPVVAVQEVWDPGRFDEIIVSTFASGASRWMQVDLPHRVAKLTDCTVRQQRHADGTLPVAISQRGHQARRADGLVRHDEKMRPEGHALPPGVCSLCLNINVAPRRCAGNRPRGRQREDVSAPTAADAREVRP